MGRDIIPCLKKFRPEIIRIWWIGE